MGTNSLSTHEIVRLFIHTDKLHRNLIESKMSKLNLHRSQHIMLCVISELEKTGAPSQSDIAQKLDISAATVAVTLKRLGAAGYIKKTDCQNDSRCKKISVTQSGKDILTSAKAIFEEVDEKMLSHLSDEELENFISVLIKIQENLKNNGAILK